MRTGVYGLAQENGKILVVMQQKGAHKGKFDLPGGGLDHGETIEEALRRELLEETGMTFRSMHWIENCTATIGSLHQVGLIYQIESLAPVADRSTELSHFWIEPEQLLSSPLVVRNKNSWSNFGVKASGIDDRNGGLYSPSILPPISIVDPRELSRSKLSQEFLLRTTTPFLSAALQKSASSPLSK